MFCNVNILLFSSLLNMITASVGKWVGGRWVGGLVSRWSLVGWSVVGWFNNDAWCFLGAMQNLKTTSDFKEKEHILSKLHL